MKTPPTGLGEDRRALLAELDTALGNAVRTHSAGLRAAVEALDRPGDINAVNRERRLRGEMKARMANIDRLVSRGAGMGLADLVSIAYRSACGTMAETHDALAKVRPEFQRKEGQS